MQSEFTLSYSTLYGFLLVLTRIAGVFTFVPLPGAQSGPPLARIGAALGCTLAMYSRWPVVDATNVTPGVLIAWIVCEAALGITAGIAIGFIVEAMLFGAQVLSLQVGYAYASVIDPNTQTDAGILLVLSQLLGGMLFFATGLDRQLLLALAGSLASWPPGTFSLSVPMANSVIHIASYIFNIGFRIALPITGLLLMVDIALAVLGRINSQLQVTLLAFPLKMLIGILLLAALLVLYPSLFENFAHQCLAFSRGILLR